MYRTRIEIDRAEDRQQAFERVRDLLDAASESPGRQEAWRLANDRLDLTIHLRAAAPSSSRGGGAVSRRVVDASARLERGALAGVVAHDALLPVLAELPPEHFHDPALRAVRSHLVDGTPLDDDGVGLFAELAATASADGIDEPTGKELLLRVRIRELQRELQHADISRTKELQETLMKVREAVAALG